MEHLLVDPGYRPLFLQLGLKSTGDVHGLLGGPQTISPGRVRITARSLGCPGGEPLAVFYKEYCFARPSWRFWARHSKARREYENYAVFERLGVSCARRVACGESRDGLGRLRHAFILTRAVPHTVTLLEFAQKLPPSRGSASSRIVRDALINQLAEMTRRIHDAGFFHNDLYWRNILVQTSPGREPKLWWIDCPRGGFARWPGSGSRRRLKDLAALDISASKLCPATERLRFLLKYLGIAKLDAQGKAMVRDILRYRRKRWPWGGPGQERRGA